LSDSRPQEPESREAGEVARLLSYVVVLAASVFLFFDARALPSSRWDVLGAGAFPQLVFAVLGLLAAIAALGSLRSLHGPAFTGFAGAAAAWLRARYLVVLVLALFGVYLVVLPLAGFSLATFGYLLVSLVLLSPRSRTALMLALIIALIFSFGLNALFAEVFNVFLPRGGW
jgi:hypothetical protein